MSTEASTPAIDSSSPAAEGSGDAPTAAAASPAEVLYPSEGSPVPSDEPNSASAAPGDEAVVEGEGAADEPPSPSDLAASYELSLPEGFTADEGLLTSARERLADAGVPKDKAQPIIDLYVKAQTDARAAEAAAFEATQSEWMNTINSMPAFQGPTREKSLNAIGKMLDEFGPEAKTGIFADPRVGNNPQMVAFLHKMAQHLSEGTPVPAGRPAPNDANGRPLKGRSAADILYPNA